MFAIPAVMGMSISATRMYRSLTDVTNPEYYISQPLYFILMLTATDVAELFILILPK
jgi:hypothetical protein